MKLIVNIEKNMEVNLIFMNDQQLVFEYKGKNFTYDYVQNGDDFMIKSGSSMDKVTTLDSRDILEIFHQGKYFQVKLAKSNNTALADEGVHQADYVSPMPGKISKIMVKVSQEVKKGDVLVYLEAMKMEHPIKAKMDGLVENIGASVGQQVDQGQLLIKLKIL